MLKIIKVFLVGLFFIANFAYADGAKIKDIEKVRQAIVTINSRVSVSAYQNTGNWSGTGFIADKNNGFIITNNHVVGRGSVGTYFITFHNGQQAEAKVVYYDSYADFAILKIDPEELPEQVEKIEFADKVPQLGQDVFIVGNTEGQSFSFHSGYISDLFEITGEMPQGSYVINMNSTGGSSGSPILNSDNKAIGVLYGGGKTYALALKGSYVTHALKAFQGDTPIKRKHIGVITYLYSLDKAVKHRSFSRLEMEKYIKKFPNARNRAIAVHSVLEGSTSASIIIPGDIIWEVEGRAIGGDLTMLDQAMNEATSDKIKLVIYREGKKIEKEVKLYDLEKNKVVQMLDFAGAIFFEADDYVSRASGIPIGSVTVTNVQTGSSFSSIPEMYVQNYKSIYRIVVKSINRAKISNLSELIAATNEAIKQKFVNVAYKNYQPYLPPFTGSDNGFISAHEDLEQDITFDSIDTKPRILKYDNKINEWISEEI